MSSIKRRALESSTVTVLLRHRILIVCMFVCFVIVATRRNEWKEN